MLRTLYEYQTIANVAYNNLRCKDQRTFYHGGFPGWRSLSKIRNAVMVATIIISGSTQFPPNLRMLIMKMIAETMKAANTIETVGHICDA